MDLYKFTSSHTFFTHTLTHTHQYNQYTQTHLQIISLWTYAHTHAQGTDMATLPTHIHIHTHAIPLRHRVYIQGDFGCRTTDGEATALFLTAFSGSDSRLRRHSTLPDQRPLMPTTLLHMILSVALWLLTLSQELYKL